MADNFSDEPSGNKPHAPVAPVAQPSTLNSQPPLIPDHELLKKIGEGSYGEVWLARSAVGTLRAVKIVWRKTFWSNHPFEREFKGIQKFEPISRDHEGLVDILQIGRGDGYFYYVMELADDAEGRVISNQCSVFSQTPDAQPPLNTGHWTLNTYTPRTLDGLLRPNSQLSTLNLQPASHRLPVAECVRIGLMLTSALGHLHRHKLVHRDVKPSNVIFVGGAPKLADIGLVTETSEARSYVGTEGFIPPEGPGTPQADLYSLGKLLYEISTGKDRHAFPELPSDLAEQNEAEQLVELNAILLKACQNDVNQRYRSAEEMHAELALLQRGQSVKAKRATQRRFAVAKKVAAAAALLAILLAGIWFLSTQLSHRSVFQVKRHLNSAQKQEVERLYKEGIALTIRQTKEDFAQGVNLLNQATAIDPDYAPAYVALAEAYTLMCDWRLPPSVAMTEAKRNAVKAADIDEGLVDAHFWLLLIKLAYDWDWVGAEKECQRIRKLNPAGSHRAYALYLQATGRLAGARKELMQAYELGPSSLYLLGDLVDQSLYEHDYDRAVNFGRKMVEMETNHVTAYQWLAKACVEAGLHAEALTAIQTARRIDDGVDMVAEHGYILARMSRREEAFKLIDYLDNLSGQTYVSPWYKAQIYAGLGEIDRAMDCLQKAQAERSRMLVHQRFSPAFDGLRSDRRFIALYKKMGLEK